VKKVSKRYMVFLYMVADINKSAAIQVAGSAGDNAIAHTVDVASGASMQAMATAAIDHFGQLDIMVNNAGITHLPQAMEDITEDDFDRVLAVNAKSVYLSAKYIVPHMKSNGAGAILNVASTAGVWSNPSMPLCCQVARHLDWMQHPV